MTVNATVNFPGMSYVCEGFCTADDPPSPNDHAHNVGLSVADAVKATDAGAVSSVGVPENDIAGS